MEVRYEYYMSQFGGKEIPEEKFKRDSGMQIHTWNIYFWTGEK